MCKNPLLLKPVYLAQPWQSQSHWNHILFWYLMWTSTGAPDLYFYDFKHYTSVIWLVDWKTVWMCKCTGVGRECITCRFKCRCHFTYWPFWNTASVVYVTKTPASNSEVNRACSAFYTTENVFLNVLSHVWSIGTHYAPPIIIPIIMFLNLSPVLYRQIIKMSKIISFWKQ